MQTRKKIKVSRTNLSTVGTDLGSYIRIDKENSFSLSFSLVFDKALKLIKTPTIQPSIESLSHKFVPALSYSFKVLQYKCVSRSNNLLADYMINSTHVTFLPSRNSFKLSLRRLCAFTLEFSPQILVLHNFGLMTAKNLTIRTDSKVIYSDINTQNLISTRIKGFDIFRECDVKKQYSFSVFNNFKSLVSPIKIFPIIFRNSYGNIFSLSWCKSGNSNLIKGKRKEISVETYRTRFYNRFLFKLSGFKIFRSFSNSFTGKISREPLSQIFINKMMELESIAYLGFKTLINSILYRFEKSVRHIKQFFIIFNLQFYRGDKFHNEVIKHNLYINFMEVIG